MSRKKLVFHFSIRSADDKAMKFPWSGSLFIRTASGKVLYPGELNTVRNAIKFEDFLEDFLFKLPNAVAGVKYTLVGFSEGYVVKAITNLKGEDLYKGITGESVGDVFKGVDKDEVGRLVVKDTKYCIEILEQNPLETFTAESYSKTNWSDPSHINQKEIDGVAGKTCFVVLPKGTEELESDFYKEFELLIETFESHLRNGISGGGASSKLVRAAVNNAIQQQAAYIGNPAQNYIYSNRIQGNANDNFQRRRRNQWPNY